MANTDRETGWYWITGMGDDPEIALWSCEGQVWNVIGGFEGLPNDEVRLISERIEQPGYWRSLD